MFKSKLLIIFAFICFNEIPATALPYENEYGPGYGDEWIYFQADNGTTHKINFTALPPDTRGIVFGDVYFYLYTRRNHDAELLTVPDNDVPLNSKYFDASHDIKIVTHGWVSSESDDWMQKIKGNFLNLTDVNVINVDWSELAGNPVYPWSAFSTRYVGRRIAKLIKALAATYNIKGGNIHLIGHSLGAHVMGYAGMFSEERVYRITGLDPARPLFEIPKVGRDYRLEKSDADFVDIIHTGGGVLGYKKSDGHADFYPNSGRPKQPGCEGPQKVFEGCSHGRSCEFFAESIINAIPFTAYPCESWEKFDNGECTDNPTDMGCPATTDRVGDFYLHTRAHPKYAMGETKNDIEKS